MELIYQWKMYLQEGRSCLVKLSQANIVIMFSPAPALLSFYICIGKWKLKAKAKKVSKWAHRSNLSTATRWGFSCVLSSYSICSSCSVHSIEVEEIAGSGSIYVQSDGEHLGFLPRKFCILPSAVEMICWHSAGLVLGGNSRVAFAEVSKHHNSQLMLQRK